MKVYILSPVRNVTQEQQDTINEHVNQLNLQGHEVYLPIRDVNQEDPTGFDICSSHYLNMLNADRVDVFWDISSTGSHFDLGMAFASGKRIKLITSFSEDCVGKSYLKFINELESLQSKSKNAHNNYNYNLN